jgi:hypothetical protein
MIMKTITKVMLLGGFMISLLNVLVACSKDDSNIDAQGIDNVMEVSFDGTSALLQAKLGSLLTGNLSFSESELDILLHMKEEEKLAGDVYTALYEKWGTKIFSNISRAEDTHMNAVLLLLQNHGDDYTQVGEPGEFSNPDFQELYGQLVGKGSESLEEAFKVGALIEELDIKDLEEYLDEVTNENIIFVFENLVKGSRNHLRAFNRQLTRLGIAYEPEYITQEEYDQIVNSPMETGNASQTFGNNGNRRQNRHGW